MRFSLDRLLRNLRFKMNDDHGDLPTHTDGEDQRDLLLGAPVYVQVGNYKVEVWAADFDYSSHEIVLKLKGDRS